MNYVFIALPVFFLGFLFCLYLFFRHVPFYKWRDWTIKGQIKEWLDGLE